MITRADREGFLERGYMVVEGIVPEAACRRAIEAICEFVGADVEEPATWPTSHGHGIVPLHHDPSLWEVRQQPSVHRVFAELYETEKLWVSMDRVSFKAPAGEQEVRVAAVHWDVDPRRFRGMGVQGLVYLTDTDASQGAFACVPGIYARLDDWLAEQPDDASLRRPDVADDDIVSVGGPAGSLLVWHRLMPHTSARNGGEQPRLVQYVAMRPVGNEDERAARVREFSERRAPAWALRQKVPGQQDPEPHKPVALTALGRRLVGLDEW